MNTEYVAIEIEDTPGSALALIDGMADDKLFSPGSITDVQLATMRSDRLAEAKRQEDARIAAAVEAAKQATRKEVIAELQAESGEPEDGDNEVSEPLEEGELQPTAYNSEKVPQSLPMRPTETREQMVNREIVESLMGCGFDRQPAIRVLTAITKGLIPHISVHYSRIVLFIDVFAFVLNQPHQLAYGPAYHELNGLFDKAGRCFDRANKL